MSRKKQQTNIEHYVPRVYLKGFSDNNKSVYAYSLKDDKEILNCSIETACQERWLYEFKNDDDKLILANLLEDILAKVEILFSKYRDILIKKAYQTENLKTKCFFTTEEKAFWKVYIVIQMLRTPSIINGLTDRIKNQVGEEFTTNEVRNYTLISVLPILKELRIENNAFSFLLGLISQDHICAFVDNSHGLFTTDNPIACDSPKQGSNEIELLYFPVTTDIAIILFGGELKKEYGRNRLYYFNSQQLLKFKQGIAFTAQNMIYSKCKLSKDDIELIKNARESNKV